MLYYYHKSSRSSQSDSFYENIIDFMRYANMTSIKISNQLSTTSTTVSNAFIDHYMPPANGEFVKVYLYLIRMAACGQAPTIADMADALTNTESDILRALKYWQKQHLLVLHCNSFNEPEFIELLPIQTEAGNSASASSTLSVVACKEEEEKLPAAVVPMPPAKPNYSMSMLSQVFETTDLEHLPYEAEVLLGKPIVQSDLATLFYIHDQLGFSPDLISYLIEYCVDKGKKSFRYMEKVALNWHENCITTTEQAKQYCESHSDLIATVKRCLGLSTLGEEARRLTSIWSEQYHFEQELIEEACNRAYKRTGGDGALNYADAILKNWHQKNIVNLEQLTKEDERYRASYQQETKRKTTGFGQNAKKPANAFHDFVQGEEIDYDALLPKEAQFVSFKKEN